MHWKTAWIIAAAAACSSASPAQEAVQAREAAPGQALRFPAAEERAARALAPINEADYIPLPMPVSDSRGGPGIDPRTAGEAVVFDATTGATRTVRVGQSGADGGATAGSLPRAAAALEGVGDSFTALSQIADPSVAPWRMNCKLFMKFTSTSPTVTQFGFVASGSMVDPATVLTAGHCVFTRTATINGTTYTFNAFPDEIIVVPGYNNSNEPYGRAYGVQYASWTTWTQNGDFNGDVGIIALDRAVGFLTGWFGYGYNTDCNFFTSPATGSWNNASYPAEAAGGWNGQTMWYWFGTWDSCQSSNQVRIARAGWGGQSGSGGYYLNGSARTVYSVASNSDRATFINYCRLWDNWFNYVNGTFVPNTSRGAGVDFQPLQCRATPITIEAGNSLASLNFVLGNRGNGGFSGTYNFDVRLSTNDVISSFDTNLSSQFVGPGYSLGAASSQTINCVLPTIPVDTAGGTYWVGILGTTNDANNGNNAGGGWDAQQITVIRARPDAAAGPSPANSAIAISTGVGQLSWSPSARADLYYVYFGTTNPPPYVGAVSGASRALPALANNTRYYWRIDAANSTATVTGPTWTFMSRKINDDCNGAINIGETVVSDNLLNNDASGVGGGCAFNDSIDQWYAYTPSADGVATASLCSSASSSDTVLSVFSGACGGLRVSCDDDACSFAGPSQVEFGVRGGNTYLIRISGYNGQRPSFTLQTSLRQCLCDTNGDNVVDFLDLNRLLANYGQTAPNLLGDVNGDGVCDFFDLSLMLSRYGTNCAR